MAKFVAFVALQLVILVTGNLNIDIDGNKINTKPVPIEKVPYQVSIRLNNFHHCTGSIISSKFVLTAGICANYSPEKYKIQAGSTTEIFGGSMHTIERIIQHNDYEDKNGLPVNDIALFEVYPPFKFDKTRAIIPLSGEETQAGVLATAVGWGKSLGNEFYTTSVTLQAVNVTIINRADCIKAYENQSRITENQICAGYSGNDFFSGVSGGPLVVNGVQVGVLSWGLYAEQTEKPDIYTEVAKYKSWIRKYLPDI